MYYCDWHAQQILSHFERNLLDSSLSHPTTIGIERVRSSGSSSVTGRGWSRCALVGRYNLSPSVKYVLFIQIEMNLIFQIWKSSLSRPSIPPMPRRCASSTNEAEGTESKETPRAIQITRDHAVNGQYFNFEKIVSLIFIYYLWRPTTG